MKDRYGRQIEIGDSIQFDPKHLGSPDGQVKAVVADVRGGLVNNGDQPPHEVLTITFTQQVQMPLGASALVVVVGKDPELARKLTLGRSALV